MASKEAECQERQNIIDVDTYFMAIAFLARHRSRDPKCQVGACVVNDDRKIVGIGYNGAPIGIAPSNLPWTKNTAAPLYNKHSYVCHAEMNAIVFRNTAEVKGCTMYVTLFPCNECAKIIIQSGIKKVLYFSDEKALKEEYQASKQMFAEANIDFVQCTPTGQVDLTFSTRCLPG